MGQAVGNSLCGDSKCEGPETIENCRIDCDSSFRTANGRPSIKDTGKIFPGIIFGLGFAGSAFLLGLFTVLRKLKLFEKQKKFLARINTSKLSFLKLTGRKVTIVLAILTTLFLVGTAAAVLLDRNPDAVLLKQGEQAKPEPEKSIMNKNKEGVINQGETKSGCGNGICEPINSETKENCPEDCSGGN